MGRELLDKWRKIFINDEEFDSGELGEELGIWVFEIDIKPSKTKVVNGYYIYGPIEPQYGLFVEKTLSESGKYDVIKELVLNIIDNPLGIYGYNYK